MILKSMVDDRAWTVGIQLTTLSAYGELQRLYHAFGTTIFGAEAGLSRFLKVHICDKTYPLGQF